MTRDKKRISPDDVRWLELARDERAAKDTRSEAQRWLGDPPPNRSALAQRLRQSEVARASAELIGHLRAKGSNERH
jgi:ferric-dicitrate binding protein FerR (iron transport regulator)